MRKPEKLLAKKTKVELINVEEEFQSLVQVPCVPDNKISMEHEATDPQAIS
jgi:hypothetical protein